MQIGSWGNHTFEVNPVLIRSFTGLTIRGGAEVDEIRAAQGGKRA